VAVRLEALVRAGRSVTRRAGAEESNREMGVDP
jgi:hypothetical protein